MNMRNILFSSLGNVNRCFKHEFRKYSQCLPREESMNKLKMQAWQVHSYGEEVLLSSLRVPILHNVNEVLVQVEATSVNPIDLYMRDGYARTVLNLFRNSEMELPLTLGREFCGTIVGKGLGCDKKFQIGQRVYGFVPLHKQGSFAEYVIAEDIHICPHPEHLKANESSSLVYASMTAWSALFITGGLQFSDNKHKRVLILGASGGVGTVAVQLLKSQGIHVTGTCSTDAVPLVVELGADVVVDYTDPDFSKQIQDNRYDIILDCAKFGAANVPREWKFKQFISLNSPLMMNTDQYGLLRGIVKSGGTLVCDNIGNLKEGKIVKWAFFIPSQRGFLFVNELIKNKEVTLWYLSKGCTLESVADRFNICNKTVYYSISRVLKILNQLCNIKWPTERECMTIENDFKIVAGFPGIIGAIDGCHFKCKVPVKQHDSYQDRHFQHSITMQAICLKNLKFSNISAGYPGSLHDARILKESNLYKIVEEYGADRLFYDKYHLVGDSAYPCKTWLMTPYRLSQNCTQVQKNYNTALSKSRCFIEHAFGVLKGRWRILQYLNVYSIERAVEIVMACCVLHNYCIDNNDQFETEENEIFEENFGEVGQEDGTIKRQQIAIFLAN